MLIAVLISLYVTEALAGREGNGDAGNRMFTGNYNAAYTAEMSHRAHMAALKN